MVAVLIDRLTFRSHILDMNVDSYRLRSTLGRELPTLTLLMPRVGATGNAPAVHFENLFLLTSPRRGRLP